MEDDWREFSNFLNARGSTLPCPACGSDLWAVSKRRYFLTELPDERESVTADELPNLDVLPLSFLCCGQCSYIRLHMIGSVPTSALPPQAEPD